MTASLPPRVFAVKNWREFQHYKDRSPPWIKLEKRLLDDYEFQCLPLASKALAPMLWLLASETNSGTIEANIDKIAFRLRWPVEDVLLGLKPLIDNGFIEDASDLLADCKQNASPERERERETERERDGAYALSVQEPSAPKPTKRVRKAYSDRFELVWESWRGNPNESKSVASERFERLSEQDRKDCLTGVLAYGDWFDEETKRRGTRGPPPMLHLSTFISQRRWENLLQSSFGRTYRL
jgi:hypothetical protein